MYVAAGNSVVVPSSAAHAREVDWLGWPACSGLEAWGRWPTEFLASVSLVRRERLALLVLRGRQALKDRLVLKVRRGLLALRGLLVQLERLGLRATRAILAILESSMRPLRCPMMQERRPSPSTFLDTSPKPPSTARLTYA